MGEQAGKRVCEALMQLVDLQTEGRRDMLETVTNFQEISFLSRCGVIDSYSMSQDDSKMC